jgi:hypothetical protein
MPNTPTGRSCLVAAAFLLAAVLLAPALPLARPLAVAAPLGLAAGLVVIDSVVIVVKSSPVCERLMHGVLHAGGAVFSECAQRERAIGGRG